MSKTNKLGWVSPRIGPHFKSHFSGGIILALLWLSINAAQAQPTNYVLGTTNFLVGPAAGTNSVVLGVTPATGSWTATANTNWLHLSPANQSGTGSTNIIFSYDSNPGATRSGTLTIGDQTLTVNQAGSTYVAAGSLTTLVSRAPEPSALTVNGTGDVYFTAFSRVMEWTPANNTATKLVSDGGFSQGVALDSTGNVYIAYSVGDAVLEWTPASSNLITLIPNLPNWGVAVDSAGNVYIAEGTHPAIEEWTAANSNLTTLVSSGLSDPFGIALDSAGNVYIANFGSNTILEWMAASSNVITLVSSGLDGPGSVAVDGAGNVYIADTGHNAIQKWTVANNTLTTLVPSHLNNPEGVAVDSTGDVYIADFYDNAIKELPCAFVDPTAKHEPATAGIDSLPPVLPVTQNLLPPFAPTSDQSWLTITDITNGVVRFFFSAYTGPVRTAHISVLGQSIPITQGVIGTPPVLTGAQMLNDGAVQFAFSNTPGASFTVLSTTNLSLPLSNWTVVGAASNTAPGVFQFTSPPTTNDAQRFYSVRSP
jgi:streptogramin lyase